MIKLYPNSEVEDAIRNQAAKAGVPVTQYLAPFINAIATKQLVMVPHFPPAKSERAS